MHRLPVIAIVGRPNVGKSSLLNALVGRRISIVEDMPGVTRDRVSTHLAVGDRFVELVDTGGYGFVDPDQLTEHIRHQIETAMTRADLVLFIVDCQDGLTAADQEIASLLRRKGIRTTLVANKADGEKADVALADFARLGLGTPIGVSALRERNLDLVFDAIRRTVDLSKAPKEIPPPEMLMAIVGKRNAGKSTLVNAIAGIYEGDSDRVIVSEVPGTTRDSIDVRFDKDGKTLIVIDTAGVRKKRHMVTNDIEFYSFHRAQRSIRRADVVLLLLDATEPVSEPDKKLAQYIAEQFKPVVLVINKWDLARVELRNRRKDGDNVRDEDLMEEYREYLNEELRHLDYAPIAFVTAKESKNVQAVLDLSQSLFKQANFRLTTGKLNQAIRQILTERTPSTASGRRARVYYATQIEVAPPTIVVFVNNPVYFSDAYQRFIINRMRDLLPYPEVPIRLVVRERQQGGGKATPLEDLPEDRVKQMEIRERRPKKKSAGFKAAHAQRKPTPKRAQRQRRR
jgi:GTP-binding protein